VPYQRVSKWFIDPYFKNGWTCPALGWMNFAASNVDLGMIVITTLTIGAGCLLILLLAMQRPYYGKGMCSCKFSRKACKEEWNRRKCLMFWMAVIYALMLVINAGIPGIIVFLSFQGNHVPVPEVCDPKRPDPENNPCDPIITEMPFVTRITGMTKFFGVDLAQWSSYYGSLYLGKVFDESEDKDGEIRSPSPPPPIGGWGPQISTDRGRWSQYLYEEWIEFCADLPTAYNLHNFPHYVNNTNPELKYKNWVYERDWTTAISQGERSGIKLKQPDYAPVPGDESGEWNFKEVWFVRARELCECSRNLLEKSSIVENAWNQKAKLTGDGLFLTLSMTAIVATFFHAVGLLTSISYCLGTVCIKFTFGDEWDNQAEPTLSKEEQMIMNDIHVVV
jgi:hypothetical protein